MPVDYLWPILAWFVWQGGVWVFCWRGQRRPRRKGAPSWAETTNAPAWLKYLCGATGAATINIHLAILQVEAIVFSVVGAAVIIALHDDPANYQRFTLALVFGQVALFILAGIVLFVVRGLGRR